MINIVKRLRKGDTYGDCKHDRCMCVVMEDAADEIERLRDVLSQTYALACHHETTISEIIGFIDAKLKESE